MNHEAAQLAEALRAGKKARALSGAQIAEQIERLTGSRPSLMWVSRRLHGQIPMIKNPVQCNHCGEITTGIDSDPWTMALREVLGVDLSPFLDTGAPGMSRDQVDAVAELAAEFAVPDGPFNHMTCSEVDALAKMLRAFGHHETASIVVGQHARSDEDDEDHFIDASADHGPHDIRGVQRQ